MDGVKGCQEVWVQFQGVSLNEIKRIIRLRFHVYTDNLKSGLGIARSSTTRATK